MNCNQCGQPLEANSKFCTACGFKMGEPQNEEISATATTEGQNDTTKSLQENEYVKQGKVVSQQYWKFFLSTIKNPMLESKQLSEKNKVNGIITILLFSLLLPMFLYSLLSNAPFIQPTFGDTILKPFLFILAFILVLIAVMLGVSKLMQVQYSYFDILARYSAFLLVPVVVALASVVFSVLSVYTFSYILFIISLLTAFIATVSTLHSLKGNETKGLDVFYGIIMTKLVMIFIFFMIGDSIVGVFLSELFSFF
ncbi:zinc ribbon domain-containing protein [Alkalihalobacillus trypoxylicola]|uniref:Zinc-ribbon domain-containing protein n=1 Tax=Alkalihalobacillus trypoxylicola TaxID=519424 RepID=A0A161Q9U2_9BACI|nr:zinc ribbon domain-containing protein [Alkalihalobacillus trypoxylicola]KYG34149.1 hypothetical protein AZF04_15080 [Alkalihalobacillus trypoxylicola]